jgi:hypothetical protein
MASAAAPIALFSDSLPQIRASLKRYSQKVLIDTQEKFIPKASVAKLFMYYWSRKTT